MISKKLEEERDTATLEVRTLDKEDIECLIATQVVFLYRRRGGEREPGKC